MARWLTTDGWAGIVLSALALFVLWESRRIPFGTVMQPGPGVVPVLLALSLLVCSVAVVAGGGGAPRVAEVRWPEWRQAAAIVGACIFMALGLERLGYRLTVLVALLALVVLVERKGWLAGALFAVGFSLGSHALFHTLLRVPMPPGPFGF